MGKTRVRGEERVANATKPTDLASLAGVRNIDGAWARLNLGQVNVT